MTDNTEQQVNTVPGYESLSNRPHTVRDTIESSLSDAEYALDRARTKQDDAERRLAIAVEETQRWQAQADVYRQWLAEHEPATPAPEDNAAELTQRTRTIRLNSR